MWIKRYIKKALSKKTYHIQLNENFIVLVQ